MALFNLVKKVNDWMATTYNAYHDAASLHAALAERQKSLAANSQAKDANDAIAAARKEVDALADGAASSPGFGPLNRDLARLAEMLNATDARPSETMRAAAEESCQTLKQVLAQWRKVNTDTVPPLNKLLENYKLAPLPVVTNPPAGPPCSE